MFARFKVKPTEENIEAIRQRIKQSARKVLYLEDGVQWIGGIIVGVDEKGKFGIDFPYIQRTHLMELNPDFVFGSKKEVDKYLKDYMYELNDLKLVQE